MLKLLTPYIKKYRLPIFLTVICIIIEVVLEIFIPFFMARIVDVGIKNGDVSYVLKTGGQMLLMALLSLATGAAAARFGAQAGVGVGSELRRAMFDKTQEFSFANLDRFSTASLVMRLTTDVTNVQNAFMMIRIMVRAPFMLTCALIMAFQINSSLMRVFLVAIPVLGIGLGLISSRAFPRFMRMLKKYDKMNGTVQENLTAVRVVKAFVRESFEKLKFKIASDEQNLAAKRAERLVVMNMPLMQLTMYGCIMAVLWFGGNLVIFGGMQTGELMSFITYISQILMSLMMITMVLITMVMSKASLDRIREVLDEPIDICDGANTDLVVENGAIEFEHVSFAYGMDYSEETAVLRDINLSIQPGETIGIIGGTGSSKTTLVSLIPRMYDAACGTVRIGGRNVREYPLTNLRDACSMVLQNNVLFSGTIRENLRWGNPDATDAELETACRAAQAYDFVMSFPDGLDTVLEQGGVNVSGGQKQRLCIARALLKNPKIIILDDSTSAVDMATEAKIRRAFSEELHHITTLIIAQRITSVCDADRIIVLDDGRIDAIGTHEELMETCAIYREVAESQQKGVA